MDAPLLTGDGLGLIIDGAAKQIEDAAERLVAVEPRAAAQELHAVGQVGAHGRVAAIDVNFVDRLDFEQRAQDVAQQRFAAEQAEVFAFDALAVETDGNECDGLHWYG